MATFEELVELLQLVGAPPVLAYQLAAISAAEDSLGSPTVTVHDATKNDPNAVSVGHFQINSDNFAWLSKTLGTPVTAGSLQASVELQARAAFALATQTPDALRNWSTWQSYLKGEAGHALTPPEQHAADAIRQSLLKVDTGSSDAGSSDAGAAKTVAADAASSVARSGGLLSNPVAALALPAVAVAAIAVAVFVPAYIRPHLSPGARVPGLPPPPVAAGVVSGRAAPHRSVPSVPSYAAPPVGVAPPPGGAAPAGEAPAVSVPRGAVAAPAAPGTPHPPNGGLNVPLQAVPGAAGHHTVGAAPVTARQSGRETSIASPRASAKADVRASPAPQPSVGRTPWWVWAPLAAFAALLAAWWGHVLAAARRRRKSAATTSTPTPASPRGDVPVFRDM